MKKALVASILGLAATVSVMAQGQISLYNYAVNPVLYGTGSGGTVGNPVLSSSGFTVGYYWSLASANSSSAVNAAMTGDSGRGLVPLLTLGGQTTVFTDPGTYGPNVVTVAPSGIPSGTVLTVVMVAYNGANYANATIRGHSAAFAITAQASPITPNDVGPLTGSWSVSAVPEPSTFALAGLGLAGLLIFRRRN